MVVSRLTERPRPSPSPAPPRVLVLLCRELERGAPRLVLEEVSRVLSDRIEGVQVQLIEDLCHQTRAINAGVKKARADRLVLGLCSSDYLEAEVQAQARRAGVDPMGIQTVGLASGGRPGAFFGNAKASVVLAAAVARAKAFPGSEPENQKTVLLPLQQKVSRRALFTMPPVSYQAVPTVRRGPCLAVDGCDLCVQACPYGALVSDGTAIRVDRAACRSCGVCVATCPQRAVAFPGWSPEEVEASVATLLHFEADLDSRAIAFTCKGAPALAGEGWLSVPVPCVGGAPVVAILQALAQGARAVALNPCREDCQASPADTVRSRVDYCRRLLELLRESPERVQALYADDGPVSAPALPPVPGEAPPEHPTFFGRGEAAQAVLALAGRVGAADVVLEHPSSPLGIVDIKAQACSLCGTCASACPTGALSVERRDDGVALVFDASLCSACDECVQVCPENAADAITLARTTDLRRISAGPEVLVQDDEVVCERCGAPIATHGVLERIAVLIGESQQSQLLQRLCISCRGLPFNGFNQGSL